MSNTTDTQPRATRTRTYRWLALADGDLPAFTLEVPTRATDEPWLAAMCQLVASLIKSDPTLLDLGWDDETYAVERASDEWRLVSLDADLPHVRPGDAAPPEAIWGRAAEGPTPVIDDEAELPEGWRRANVQETLVRDVTIAYHPDLHNPLTSEGNDALWGLVWASARDLQQAELDWDMTSICDEESGEQLADVG